MWSRLHVRWGNPPHVTSPTWGPPPSCKQTLKRRWCYSRQFATTILSAIQRCNIVSNSSNIATLCSPLGNDDGHRQRELQKRNWFRLAKQQLCTCITLFCTFFCLHFEYDVKMPIFTFRGGRERKTTTFFFFSSSSIQSFRIQLQKKLPTFVELNEME